MALIAHIVLILVAMSAAGPCFATIAFQDDFEYVANRNVTDVQIPFEAAGWTDCKAENSDYGSSGGYLYTLDDATLGSKVLVMESLPTTVGGQTAYHLQYGSDVSALGTIPADVWFQFWTYAVPGSEWDRQKFLYPCHVAYPCPNGPPENAHNWLVSFNATNGVDGVGSGVVTAPTGGRYFRISGATVNHSAAGPGDTQKLYQNLAATPLLEGTWYLVKIHFNTSGAQGTYEMWMRQRGTAAFTKEAEWLGGVTADLDWPIHADRRSGDRVLAIPTTVDTLDSTTYMDDFVMATSESDLPTYNDSAATPSAVAVVRMVRFIGLAATWVSSAWSYAHLILIACWLWMQRQKIALYISLYRYRRAVKRWQAQAPMMLADHSNTITLNLQPSSQHAEATWRQ